jgi:hypothetical protein
MLLCFNLKWGFILFFYVVIDFYCLVYNILVLVIVAVDYFCYDWVDGVVVVG